MKKRKNKKLETLIIKSTILLLFLFSVGVVIIGYNRFTNTFTKEYNGFSERIADTAATIINADKINYYYETNNKDSEYKLTNDRLKILTNKMDVSVIYVIKPDADYKNYTSIYNSVNDNSGYTPWELGEKKKTTNTEYEKSYKALMEKKQSAATIKRVKDLNGAIPHITTLVPLKDSKGNVVAIMCVQRFMKGLTSARHNYVIGVTILTFILIILTFVVIMIFVRRQIVKPIKLINEEAERFSNQSKLIEKKLENISKISEIEGLAEAINKMEIDIANYIDNLTKVTKEKERIGTELRLATAIQENSIPNIFPPYPHRKEFDLFASMTPAKEVGGDFYDFYLVDDNHLAMVIADVSGKGIPAALTMMATKILISENLLAKKSASEVLSVVNNRINKHNNANMFVTVWIGILDLTTGILTAANAGHEYPTIYRKDKKFEVIKDKHGIVLGAMEDFEYEEYEIKLNKGDKIFVYTDGVVEATNSDNEMYGIDRMVETLNKLSKDDIKDILKNMKKDVDSFVGKAVQFDDLTMLGLEYYGKKKESSNEKRV